MLVDGVPKLASELLWCANDVYLEDVIDLKLKIIHLRFARGAKHFLFRNGAGTERQGEN